MQACGEKLFAVVNFYNKGSMSSMSITALFEVIALLITRYMYRIDTRLQVLLWHKTLYLHLNMQIIICTVWL